MDRKITFALFIGNRGFFPAESIDGAIADMKEAVKRCGCDFICMPIDATRYGAVETIAEGEKYAEFLSENRGKYDGVILCMPNFSDENGAYAALKNAGVPILIQAYPDEIGNMDFEHRRDAMCGKFAICNVLRQAGIPFTLTKKFVVDPKSDDFNEDLKRFESICRIVRGMRSLNIGAVGARTTAFKTVRADETALMRNGINVESFDMSEVFARMRKVPEKDVAAMSEKILKITNFENKNEEKLEKMARLQAVLEQLIGEYSLSAIALRCWSELQTEVGIAPCTNLGVINDLGVSAACEVDVTNSVMMRALALSCDGSSTLLDFNNNYGDSEDRCIMFHCGPVPISMMEDKGELTEHLMFKKSYGEGTGVGVNKGRIKSGPVTFGSVKTENGRVCAFITEGEFTDDEIEEGFFGTGKVVKKDNIGNMSNFMAENGYKHHLAVSFGHTADAVAEALGKYLGYDVSRI